MKKLLYIIALGCMTYNNIHTNHEQQLILSQTDTNPLHLKESNNLGESNDSSKLGAKQQMITNGTKVFATYNNIIGEINMFCGDQYAIINTPRNTPLGQLQESEQVGTKRTIGFINYQNQQLFIQGRQSGKNHTQNNIQSLYIVETLTDTVDHNQSLLVHSQEKNKQDESHEPHKEEHDLQDQIEEAISSHQIQRQKTQFKKNNSQKPLDFETPPPEVPYDLPYEIAF